MLIKPSIVPSVHQILQAQIGSFRPLLTLATHVVDTEASVRASLVIIRQKSSVTEVMFSCLECTGTTMAGVNTEKRQRHRHLDTWRKNSHRLSRRLLCCSCLPCEEQDSPQEQEMKINGTPQNSHLDHGRSGEMETIQITVEDLGIVNASFSLLDEEPQIPRNNLGRSASSVSTCAWALKKKGLRPLSSLSIQTYNEPAVSREDDEDEDEDALMYDSGTDSTPASGSLLSPAPPVITLIPPTPSDVDDQFFEINSEESVSHTCGSDGSFTAGDQEVYEHKTEGEKSDESDKGQEETRTEDGLDNFEELDQALSGQSEDGGEAVTPKEKSKSTFLRSAYQVPPLPGFPQTSECSSLHISSIFTGIQHH